MEGMIMKAAVITELGEAPRYADAQEPEATGEDEVVVEVLAAALSPRVRSQAAGTHYTSTDEFPLIPGIDGVGRLPSGALVYFLLPDTNKGAMAERTTVDMRRAVPLPKDADPVTFAAVMNPAMASWVALRRRIKFRPGQSVLILGATGNAGRCAVQVAKHLEASQIIAVGRTAERMRELSQLEASRIIELGDDESAEHELADAGKDIDVVVDFLWGEPASKALCAIVPNRTNKGQLLTWIQIGSVAGLESPIPSAALRAINLQIIGSGQGSVSPADYRNEVEELASEVLNGTFDTAAREVSLSQVEAAWVDTTNSERIVIVP
jgi:NADPH:quinone reductase-like Zn-dependent oxidoreductase